MAQNRTPSAGGSADKLCELIEAWHQEELPPSTRTVVSVYGAMRGVGGIDSWGSDVQPPWRVSAEGELTLAFRLRPGR